MSNVSWTDAASSVIGPAIVVGPLTGAIGGIGISIFVIGSEILAGGNVAGDMVSGTLTAIGMGGILGLFIAFPACLIFGTIMFHWSTRHDMCRNYLVWAAFGMIAGLSTSAIFGLIFNDMTWTRTAWLSTPLGAIGAAICRWMVDQKLRDLSER